MRASPFAFVCLCVLAACASGGGDAEQTTRVAGVSGGSSAGTAGATSGAAGAGATAGVAASGFPSSSGTGGGGGAPAGAAGSPAGAAGSPAGAAGSPAGAAGSPAGAAGATGGDAGAPGGAGGTAGSSPCTPQCGGKQCGPDGCNGSCGACGPADVCTAGGTCAPKCPATWTAPLTFSPERLALDGATLFVTGLADAGGAIAALSTCDGALLSSATVGGAGANLLSVVPTPSGLFVVGSTADDGYIATLAKSPLALTWETPLFGSNGVDAVWDMALTPSGNGLLAGASQVGTAEETPWLVGGAVGSTSFCGFPPFPGEAGVLFGALSDPQGRVFVGGRVSAKGVIARFPDKNCGAPCGCTPDAVSKELDLAAGWTEVRALAQSGGKLFAVGYGTDGVSDAFSFLARFDADSLALEAVYKHNPSPTSDAFLTVAVDGGVVTMGGFRGWQGDTSFTSATAQVVTISSSFGPGTPPIAIKEPVGAHYAWSVVVSGGATYASMLASTGIVAKL